MNLEIQFRNEEQEKFFWHTQRNGRFGGGFGNGKTYVACQRALVMLMTFSGYRVAFCRQVFKRLRLSTMQTFFKVCPKEFIFKHDETNGITVFINGSVAYWLHLDMMDEATAKGFEINALVIDQAEEVDEGIYLLMDSRVGRWDQAKVPEYLLQQFPDWPKNKWGTYLVPNYVDILDNPSDDEYHWVPRYFDEDSVDRKVGSFSIVRQTDDDLNDKHTIENIKTRSPEWLEKYYYGRKGKNAAIIHRIPKECILVPKDIEKEKFDKLINDIRTKGALYRTLDHGEASPTAVVFGAAIRKVHIFFGEYYTPNESISVHRQNIHDISIILAGEFNLNSFTDYADPSITKPRKIKGQEYTLADEYADTEEIEAPPFYWIGADNNEYATRNRINELLKPSTKFYHPITNETPAPGIYFISRDAELYPFGCYNLIHETNRQKRELIDNINGTNVYSDERDIRVPDHAYDCLRYYIAAHNTSRAESDRPIPKKSFANYRRVRALRQKFFRPTI